eukprot:COSAG06_NODE_2363_length_7003_cov_5.261008_4_plen_90_part_00
MTARLYYRSVEDGTLGDIVPLEGNVVTVDGEGTSSETQIGVYTSQVDAWQVAKPIGAVMWRCAPNSGECVSIQRAIAPERRAIQSVTHE